MKPDSNSSNDQSKMLKKNKASMKKELNFQDFMLDLKNARSDSKVKDPVPYVHRLIKKGFREMITPSHLDQICQLIFPWEHFPRLALKLAIEVITGRPTGLMRRLMDLIRRDAARRTSFPLEKIPLVTNVPDLNRRSVLEEWIEKNSPQDTLDHNWARNALVCLLGENFTYEEFLVVQLLIQKCSSKRKKVKSLKSSASERNKEESNRYEKYIKQVGSLFTSKKFSPSKLTFGVDIHRIFQTKFSHLESRVENLEMTLSHEKNKSSEILQKLNLKETELKETIQAIPQLKEEIQAKEKSLLDEKSRFKHLEEHWQRKFERELRGQAYNFKRVFEHEVREAKLSLDREDPNVEMALSRIRNMEEQLAKIGVDI